MRRLFIIGITLCCLAAPSASLAQLTGGTGNHGGGMGAGAPTIEDYIDMAHHEIGDALDKGKISVGRAHHDQKKLEKISQKLDQLGKQVAELRRSLN